MKRLALFLLGVLLLTVMTLSNISTGFKLDTDLQMGMVIGGIICFGLAWVRRRLTLPHPLLTFGHSFLSPNWKGGRGVRSRTIHKFTLVVVLLLAFALRIMDLDTAIQRHVDEMNSVRAIVNLWQQPQRPLLMPNNGIAAFPPVYNLLQSWMVGIVGPGLNALRLPSVALGLMTIAAVYLLAAQTVAISTRDKSMHGWFPVLAALTLAIFPAHIHFSRIGINNIADPLFGTLALTFLLRGIRKDEALSLAIAGICLGLTQYFYEGGRLFFPVLLISTAFIAGLRTRRDWLTFVGMAIIVAAPVYLTMIFGHYAAAPRLDETERGMGYWREMFSEGPLNALTNYLKSDLFPALRFYFIKRDESWFYGELMIPAAFIPGFLTGLMLFIGRIRRDKSAQIILLWMFGVAMGNSLLGAKNDIPRYVLAFPAIALTTAYGFAFIDRLIYQIPALFGLHQRRYLLLPGAITLGLVAGVIWLQINFYFGSFVDSYMTVAPDVSLIDDIRFRAAQLPSNTQVQIITDISFFDIDSDAYLEFTGRKQDGVFINSYPRLLLDAEYIRDLAPGRNHALFVPPGDMRSRSIIENEPNFYGPYTSPYTRPPESRYLMYTSWDYQPDQ